MIYKVEQTVILDNGKLYDNMFYVLDKDLTNFLKYITSDTEGIKTYTYCFMSNLVALYELVGNHFKWQEYKIFSTDETLVEEDELFIPDDNNDYPRGKFVNSLKELMFDEIDNIESLNKIIKEVAKHFSK